jgi:kynurenine formamidase
VTGERPASWSGGAWEGELVLPGPGPRRVYDLAQPLVPGMTRHPHHPPYSFELWKAHGDHDYGGGVTSATEVISTGGHVGTHIDALGHIACDGLVHGGFVIAEHQTKEGGLEVSSTEEIPPILGPGHLIDGELLFGGRSLTPADAIGAEELARWFAERPAPGPGSIVLVRTGWIRYFDDSERYLGRETGLPGVNLEGARWLSARGVRAVGSDTMNFEFKIGGVVSLRVHVHLLVESGIYIMETLNLERLAGDGVTEFTFAAIPLRIRGGTGSPIRPVAIVDAT